MENFVILFIIFLVVIGPLAVIAVLGFATIRALGRNPSASSKILPTMIINLVYTAGVAIIGLLVLFHIFGTSS